MWSHSGRIVTNAARVYYLPDNESLPPLRWRAETQEFVYLNAERNSEDAVMRATLEELASAMSSPLGSAPRHFASATSSASLMSGGRHPSVDSMSNCVPCECLYGVLPIGVANSVLLYVTERCHVTTLNTPEEESANGTRRAVRRRHEIFLARRLEWMRLPSRAFQTNSSLSSPRLDAAGGSEDTGPGGIGDPTMGNGAGGFSEDDEDAVARMSEEVIGEYLKVVDTFCSQVSSKDGEGSYLYYCPTLNLALCPEEVQRSSMRTRVENDDTVGGVDGVGGGSFAFCVPLTPSDSVYPAGAHGAVPAVEDRRAQNSRTVFQWNHALLSAFVLPPTEEELESEMALAASTRILRRNASDMTDLLKSCTSSGSVASLPTATERPWATVRMTDACGSRRFNPEMLYVPGFIRGYVAAYDIAQESPSTLPTVNLYLITRLSCRWAGTRYNRRGLEPGSSGVPANCAVSSLYVTATPPRGGVREHKDAGSALPTERLAVLNMIRGSVPRRWEQPADLHFKPPLRFLYQTGAVEELNAHLRFIKHIFPGIRKVACVDTTSTSQLEKPLSDAYASAVRKVQREMTGGCACTAEEDEDLVHRHRVLNEKAPLSYVKFNLKAKLKELTYGDIRSNIVTELERESVGYGAFNTAKRLPPWLDFTQCSVDYGSATGGAEDKYAATMHIRPQSLYYRVNCLDCLDRTNLFQTLFAESALPHMLNYVLFGDASSSQGSILSGSQRLLDEQENAVLMERLRMTAATALRRLFVQQGTAISQMYANTEAHFIPFISHADEKGLFDDNNGTRYVASAEEALLALRRWAHQNFSDGGKQDGVSLMTLQHDPARYPSDIESPFSRDLTSMNNLVLYGIVCAVIPFIYSCLAFLSALDIRLQRNVHLTLMTFWLCYFVFLFKKLGPYRVTYTNQPLLSYTVS